MKKYQVKIVETLEKIVEIEAETIQDALQIADDKYRAADADYVLDAGNFTNVYFEVAGSK